MSTPRVLVLRAPGINCERETQHAFEVAGARGDFVHVRKLLERPQTLDDYAILAVPGGFAYGDDIAAGRVLAHEMRERLGEPLLRFVDRGGLVLGICNGFQVLVRLGILPRTTRELRQEVTLTHNLSNHYECRWVTLRSQPSRCVFVPAGLSLRVPAAHGEGYLMTRDAAHAEALVADGYVPLVYTDAAGAATAAYPDNPNGSPLGIAAMTDVSGRVFGIMPHPDRSYLGHHMPQWRRDGLATAGDGLALFAAMVQVARGDG